MPQTVRFRDKVTGQVLEFDHEPTQDELDQRAGPAPAPQAPIPHQGSAGPGLGEQAITGVGLPAVGAIIGGKTPLGPIGSGIGAATGQAFGDIYNMLQSASGKPGYGEIPTMGGEASRLAETAGLTALGEKVIPPILRGIGNIIPRTGMGFAGGTGLGYLLGHPGAGAALGTAAEMTPKLANGVEWLGTPAGAKAGAQASTDFLSQMGSNRSPGILKTADKIGNQVRQQEGGALAQVPEYLQQQNWGKSLGKAGDYLADKGNQALGGLKKIGNSIDDTVMDWLRPTPPEVAPPSSSFPDVLENIQRNATSGPSLRPDLSKTPTRKWSADLEIDPRIKPQSAVAPDDLFNQFQKSQSKGPQPFEMDGVKYAPDASGSHVAQGPATASEIKFGPNTVGAAQKPGSRLSHVRPPTEPLIDQMEGLSAKQQGAWELHKSQTGASDAGINDWLARQPQVDDYPGNTANKAVSQLQKVLSGLLNKGQR